jgi:glycosyltransferase involved in cell wall biosynthesis
VTDATILVPTYRHPRLVPYAVRSALDQQGVSVEVFVVGDGVENDTREALEPLLADERVRFFDFEKRPRHGEPSRHEALAEATGRIVCYLSDDDLLLPDHVSEMARLLEGADLVHSPHFWIDLNGSLNFLPRNLGRQEFVDRFRAGSESVGLTGVAHTLDGYRRLPHGWRTTPPGRRHTDHYMWLQWLAEPGFRGAAGTRITFLWFPDQVWRAAGAEEREAVLAEWFRRSRERSFRDEIDALARAAILRSAEDENLAAYLAKRALDEVLATRTWRARERLVSVRPLRALLARRREAR